MAKCYDNYTKEELIELLNKQDRELANKKYGLVWDSEKEPEQVVLDCENNFPILERVKEKEIKTDDSDYNILIEGDNFHSLSVLNYTHKGKIDVIYIDPPYNTGKRDSFLYNDRYVLKEDGYLHSKWLNFMEKRLNLAYKLLKDDGVIFISIDDNEQANLKLLCDKIFTEYNFISILPRLTKKGGKSSGNVQKNHDYVLVYSKTNEAELEHLEHTDKGFKYSDEYEEERGKYKLNQTLDYDTLGYVNSLDYPIIIDNKTYYAGNVSEQEFNLRKQADPKDGYRWRWSRDLFNFGMRNGFVIVNKKTNRIYTKTYQNAAIETDENGKYYVEITPRKRAISSIDLLNNEYSNDNAKKELRSILGKFKFDYPKPSQLIYDLLKRIGNKNALVLDFMAGSGTTAQAVLQLNSDDKGNRKFIICTNNENNICTDVCYPRIEKVINGYNKNGNGEFIEGLGGNLQYFKTSFIKNSLNKEQLKINLSNNCTQMLCVKEGIYNLKEESKDYKIFESNKKDKYLCVYYNFINDSFIDFLNALKKLEGKKIIYMFSSNDLVDKELFIEINDCVIETIPQKILDIYKKIVKENIKRG